MKIAVPVKNNNGFDSEVNKHFGRSPYFAIVDPDKNEVDIIKNQAANASGGAGVSAAQLVADRGVEVLLSASVGPKAYTALSSGNIKIYTIENYGSLNQAVESFENEELTQLDTPNGIPHK